MKVLLKIAKIIPKLGTTNEHEKLMVLLTIERLLAGDSISWTDAGQKLSEFLTQVLSVEEDELLEAPPPRPTPGFTRAAAPQPRPAPTTHSNFGFQAAPNPHQPPPSSVRPSSPSPPPPQQRRIRIDPRAFGSLYDKQRLVNDLLKSPLTPPKTSDEQSTLIILEFMLDSGMPLTPKQQKFLETISKRL